MSLSLNSSEVSPPCGEGGREKGEPSTSGRESRGGADLTGRTAEPQVDDATRATARRERGRLEVVGSRPGTCNNESIACGLPAGMCGEAR